MFTYEELITFDSQIGLIKLAKRHGFTVEKALRELKYEKELRKLQKELVELQQYIARTKMRVAVIFEGRDASGKGRTIKRFTEHLSPRKMRVVALAKPTDLEKGLWYFQRYFNQLPKSGEIVFFDRSWYNRAVVEPVNGFCSEYEYIVFMSHVNDFEKMCVESDFNLLKIYFSITKGEQVIRFKDIKENPLKKWKITSVDEKAQKHWEGYTKYKEEMLVDTHTHTSPWKIIKADRKSKSRIEAMQYILQEIPYIK